MKTRNVYWRKTRRHHWNCIAQCGNDRGEFVRQIHMAQSDAPKWQVGWVAEDSMSLYPGNKKTGFPMNVAPDITDRNMVAALNRFIRSGFTAITPPIMGAMVELELL